MNEQLISDLPLMNDGIAAVVQLKFSDPKQLADDLHGQGFQAVWMIDPGISATPGYFAYDSGTKEDAWVLKKDGKPFIGKERRLCPRLVAWCLARKARIWLLCVQDRDRLAISHADSCPSK